jgi:F-type H+-transporting ATPase subunit gamma
VATLREIRRRIRSIKNISQVTKAMQMVAASKMRRAQEQALATRPYAAKSWALLTHLAAQRSAGEPLHALLQVRRVNTVGVLLIASEKGLCGGYNHNINHLAYEYVQHSPNPAKLVVVGRRGRDFVVRAGLDLTAEFTGLPPQARLSDITPISHILISDFLNGTFDQVVVAYTHFVNTLVQKPVVRTLLPVQHASLGQPGGEGPSPVAEAMPVEYIYEPDPRTVLDTVIPRFTEIQIYQALLEATASEHSARMVAMRNATDNAQRLIEDLTLSYHRARQTAITREMLDIASGAEALKQSQLS